MVNIKFSSKAGTLFSIKEIVKSAKIPELFIFTVQDWFKNKSKILTNIEEQFRNNVLAVRSSSKNEDQSMYSNAGAFLSLLNVRFENLEISINRVVESYGEDKNLLDEILIQPMLKNIIRSGVAFSHDPNTCSPYRVINWSDGKSSTKVTGGMGGNIWQQAALAPLPKSKSLKSIILLIEELLNFFKNSPLDCEFAFTSQGKESTLWLLQVRPLILKKKSESEQSQLNNLKKIQSKIKSGMKTHPYLFGSKTVYGVMPDWNPAEIIGIRPKPLALSLYRELITDSIWAYQRHNYGYRNLRSFPLMPDFFGLPYIDLRLSFNSFIPQDVEGKLADKLVNFYIKRLTSEPTNHDKVEFEIVLSCNSLDLINKLEKLKKIGFTTDECKILLTSLRNITNKIIHPVNGLWIVDKKKINTLDQKHSTIMSSSMNNLEKIYWLLEDVKKYGTLPFAGLARTGFIAVQMLNSLVNVNIFSSKDYHEFIASISNISRQLATDRRSLKKKKFLALYGHLRPGTYDILSPRYDDKPELYFNWDEKLEPLSEIESYNPSEKQLKKIDHYLKECSIECNAVQFLDFIKSGIKLREYSKFSFSRHLSDILSLISLVGKEINISKNDLAFSEISTFKNLYISAVDNEKVLKDCIKRGKLKYKETQKLSLPPLITEADEVIAFKWPKTMPNFITQKQVVAPIGDSKNIKFLNGHLICITNADPGYDWLFSYPIAGIITAWGGVNSHMAIRAGELGLPSVIGCGEHLFKKWSRARRVFLDCAGRRLEILE